MHVSTLNIVQHTTNKKSLGAGVSVNQTNTSLTPAELLKGKVRLS